MERPGLMRICCLLPLIGVVACVGPDTPDFGKYTPDTGKPDQDDSQPTDDSDTQQESRDDSVPPDDSGQDSGGFDEPGDVTAEADGSSPDIDIDLTDASGESNKDQEFYLVVTNTGASSNGFRLKYKASTGANGPHGARGQAPAAQPPRSYGNRAVPPPPPALEEADIGNKKEEFLVRDDFADEYSYAPVLGTLWALRDNVSIWVDDDVAIDWDYECDGLIDVYAPYDSYGFDNCDLAITAEVLDTNIIPNTRALFGQESDIDGDGRVSVLITPVLNAITLTGDDETAYDKVLSSYAEPAVDLTEFNERSNPGSDEQEVIYVFAPDPYGFLNPNAPVTIDAYNSYQVAAEVARSFTYLISYNQHVLVNEGTGENDWLNDAMGTLAADLCGFGATYYTDVWDYLDAPHLYPLVTDSSGSIVTLDRGAQYLFARWLYDYSESQAAGNGTTVFQAIMSSSDTGVDAILDGTGEYNFGELVLKWQMALLTTGVVDGDGNPLVDPTEYPPYAPIEIISAPPSAPNGHFGANGYQVGVNLRGLNTPGALGHTETPEELPTKEIRLDGPDDYIYTPGFSFYGWMKDNYASQIIKLTGINYDQATAQIQAEDAGLAVAVVRWFDPINPDYSIENIYSPTDVNRISLPHLPVDGGIIRGVGELSAPGSTTTVGEEGEEEGIVMDTDQWLLDLTDRAIGQEVHVVAWIDRHFADSSGSPSPDDPWIAVAPAELVPAPTVYDTKASACTGTGSALDFGFPTSLLSYLYLQKILSSEMYSDSLIEDYCGEKQADPTDCSNDWDQDGVLDTEEPEPASFYEQVVVEQCTFNGGNLPSQVYSTDWLDIDELDEDDTPSANIAIGAGGHSGATGEEGYVELVVEGGKQYVIVIGSATGDTGVYEFSVREVL